MERTERRPRINALYVILALLLVAALVAGIWFLIGSGKSREPNRGTYVMAQHNEVKGA
ncbi:MAG TPA: hypothetical protein PK369_00595 [Thermoclostridium sp.]|nr:hypothetical protein [Clostridiaceae bacterium]HOQ75048.1 hypothetical protein [Thermoclostridium sp.]HPU44763.1 hypothetical protein [Thermoclostridium sp.]